MKTAIILAGGLGTRLRSAVPDLPKPMAPIHGRPFLTHQLDHWIDRGIGHFVLSVGYRHEAIVQGLGERFRGAVLDYAVEQTPLGTGGALRLAAARLPRDEPVLLLNGDTYFDVGWKELDRQARSQDAHWGLSLFQNPDPARYMGVGLAADGRVSALRDPKARWANGGVYWFRPVALDAIRAPLGQALSLENDVFPDLWAQGQRFSGMPFNANFIDIGIPADYRRAGSVLPQRTRVRPHHALHP